MTNNNKSAILDDVSSKTPLSILTCKWWPYNSLLTLRHRDNRCQLRPVKILRDLTPSYCSKLIPWHFLSHLNWIANSVLHKCSKLLHTWRPLPRPEGWDLFGARGRALAAWGRVLHEGFMALFLEVLPTLTLQWGKVSFLHGSFPPHLILQWWLFWYSCDYYLWPSPQQTVSSMMSEATPDLFMFVPLARDAVSGT